MQLQFCQPSKKGSLKAWILSGLFGVLLATALVWGFQLETADQIEITSRIAFAIWLLLAVLFTGLTNYFFRFLDGVQVFSRPGLVVMGRKRGDHPDKEECCDAVSGIRKNWRSFVTYWLLLFLCQIPVLLAEYPGFFVYDATDEFVQVQTRVFTTHHPLFHELSMGGIILAVHKVTGSYNAGIFLYLLLQALVITCVFAYVLLYLKTAGFSRWIRIITGAFYGVFPTIVMYTLCSCKDGLFSAFLILFSLELLQLLDCPVEFFQSRRHKAILVISGALLMLLRNNGFYAYLVFLPFGIGILFGRLSKVKSGINRSAREKGNAQSSNNRENANSNRVKIAHASLLILPVIGYLLVNQLLITATGATGGEHQEMLTVPIQQLARTYQADPEDFTEEEKEILFSYISEEGLSHYTPRISDITKSYFNNNSYDEDSASFWHLWLQKGKEHPMSYVNAWLLTSYGFWYPGAVINVYSGNEMYTFTYTESSYFGYEVEPPGERHSLIPAIDRFYRKLSLEKFQQEIPIIHLFFAPAFWFWLFFLGMCYIFYRDGFQGLFWCLIVFLVWLTVLLGPTYLVRYAIYLWTIAPLMVARLRRRMI